MDAQQEEATERGQQADEYFLVVVFVRRRNLRAHTMIDRTAAAATVIGAPGEPPPP